MQFDYRRTKIIFTIGPATESEEMLERLIRNGVDVCRLNMAHANHEWTRTVIRRIRASGDHRQDRGSARRPAPPPLPHLRFQRFAGHPAPVAASLGH